MGWGICKYSTLEMVFGSVLTGTLAGAAADGADGADGAAATLAAAGVGAASAGAALGMLIAAGAGI